jgi:hypothetical protein
VIKHLIFEDGTVDYVIEEMEGFILGALEKFISTDKTSPVR